MPHQPSKRGRGRGAARPTRKQAKTAAAAALPITDGEVQWATVQVDVAAERLKAAEHKRTAHYANTRVLLHRIGFQSNQQVISPYPLYWAVRPRWTKVP